MKGIRCMGLVYLRLQPGRQTTVSIHGNLKLAPRYFRPYQVITRIGKVAYRLQLPIKSHVHSVFHVSKLKKRVEDLMNPNSILPKTGPNGQFLVFPIAILAREMIKRKNQAVTQYLI